MAFFIDNADSTITFGSLYDVFSERAKDTPSGGVKPENLCEKFSPGHYVVSKHSDVYCEAEINDDIICDFVATYTVFHHEDSDPEKIISILKTSDCVVKPDVPIWFSSDFSECGNYETINPKTLWYLRSYIEMLERKVQKKTMLLCSQKNLLRSSDPSEMIVRADEHGFVIYIHANAAKKAARSKAAKHAKSPKAKKVGKDNFKMLARGVFYENHQPWSTEPNTVLATDCDAWMLLKPDIFIVTDGISGRCFAIVINQHEFVKRYTNLGNSVCKLLPEITLEYTNLSTFVEERIVKDQPVLAVLKKKEETSNVKRGTSNPVPRLTVVRYN